MNKKYKQKVIQYSIDGVKLKTFENATKASLEFSNYESIIFCCLKKHKTAGGFIWRFEGDEFSLYSKRDKKRDEKLEHTCKICNASETIRSMAMHLRWVHNMKTEQYVSLYGEYRPKETWENGRKNDSNIKCEICDEKMMSNPQLMQHLTRKHKDITHEEYIIKHVYGGENPTCKCGCGERVSFLRHGSNERHKETYFRDYIKGHHLTQPNCT